MKRLLIAALCLSATALGAAEVKLTTDEITALLPTVVAIGEGTRQTFSAAGATTYTQGGRDSYGSWWAAGDQYCSRWPPGNGTTCYDILLDDTPADGGAPVLRWIGESGNATINHLEPKE